MRRKILVLLSIALASVLLLGACTKPAPAPAFTKAIGYVCLLALG